LLPVAHLPAALAGKRLVQISDLHVGPQVDDKYLMGTLDRVRDLSPDILVITGDFVSYWGDGTFPQLDKVLRHLPHGKRATLAALGNHDMAAAGRNPTWPTGSRHGCLGWVLWCFGMNAARSMAWTWLVWTITEGRTFIRKKCCVTSTRLGQVWCFATIQTQPTFRSGATFADGFCPDTRMAANANRHFFRLRFCPRRTSVTPPVSLTWEAIAECTLTGASAILFKCGSTCGPRLRCLHSFKARSYPAPLETLVLSRRGLRLLLPDASLADMSYASDETT